jgi:hypothetical protein
LNEQRRLDKASVEEVLQVVKVRDVVALELEPGPVVGTRREDGAAGSDPWPVTIAVRPAMSIADVVAPAF